MNSEQIKKHYKDIYEQFYLVHDIVLSSPFIINWSWDVRNNDNRVSIKQKIPFRMYIGWKKTKEKGIKLGEIHEYNPLTNSFTICNPDAYLSYDQEVLNALNENFPIDYGLEISILTELPKSFGMSFTTVFTSLIFLLCELFTGKLDSEKLIEGIKGEISDQTNLYLKEQFSNPFQLKLKGVGKIGYSTKITSLFEGDFPVIGFRTPKNVFYGFRMNEVFKSNAPKYNLPIDYAIVYSGKSSNLETIDGINTHQNDRNDKMKFLFEPLFADLFTHHDVDPYPQFYNLFLAESSENIHEIYSKVMWSISIEILYGFYKVLQPSASFDEASPLLGSLQKIMLWNRLTRKNDYHIIDFMDEIRKIFKDIKHAIFPNDSTISSGCAVVASLNGYEKWRFDQVNDLAQSFGGGTYYSSWIDWTEKKWLIIEQFLSKGIMSSRVKKNDCIKGKKSAWVLLLYENLQEAIKLNDICVDMIHSKIYINWDATTSNELSTQWFTCVLLNQIILSPSEKIFSKELPTSSYAKNKSEFMGKIIYPLIKVIKERTGKELNVQCDGSGANYHCSMDFADLSVVIIGE
jgi:hypothetical protein